MINMDQCENWHVPKIRGGALSAGENVNSGRPLCKLRRCKGLYNYVKAAICLILASNTQPTPSHAGGGGRGVGLLKLLIMNHCSRQPLKKSMLYCKLFVQAQIWVQYQIIHMMFDKACPSPLFDICIITMHQHDISSWHVMLVYHHDVSQWYIMTILGHGRHIWWPYMTIPYDGHRLSSYPVVRSVEEDDHLSWLCRPIYDHHIWRTTCKHHIRWSYHV